MSVENSEQRRDKNAKGKIKEKVVLEGISWTVILLMRKQVVL